MWWRMGERYEWVKNMKRVYGFLGCPANCIIYSPMLYEVAAAF